MFWVTIEYEVYTEKHSRVSPYFEPTGGDYLFYKKFSSTSESNSNKSLTNLFSSSANQEGGNLDNRRPGALFPALLGLFEYRQGNTFVFATFHALLGFGLCCTWIVWLAERKIGGFWLALFAVLPSPIWYSMAIQSDLLFSVAVFVFYALISADTPMPPLRLVLSLCLMGICLLIRPNALALIPIALVELHRVSSQMNKTARSVALACVAIAASIAILYYWPYGLRHLSKSAEFRYFGIIETDYLDGIYPSLPLVFDQLASWTSLVIAKFLYLGGVRPSYSGISWWIVLARSATGVMTVPGLIYVLFWGNHRDRVFCGLFILPFVLGVAQERYLLPIQGILYFYGVLFWERAMRLARDFKAGQLKRFQ